MELRKILIAAAGIAAAVTAATSASADTQSATWRREHPGRAEVATRIRHLDSSIRQQRVAGHLTAYQARTRLARVHHIYRQEVNYAHRHHSHLSPTEQARLNHEETGVRAHIPG